MKLLQHNMELYNKIIEKMKKYNDICIVQGTGGGKSYLLMYLIVEIFKDKKIAVVTPMEDIQKGIMEYPEFKEVENNITFFTNYYFNSLDKAKSIAEEYDVVFVDEVHHIGSEIFGTCLQSLKNMMVKQNKYFFGLTATPIRSSDKIDVKNLFSASVVGYSAFDFIHMGLMPQIEYLICEPEALDRAKKEECKEVIDYESSIDLLKEIIENNRKNKWLCYFSSVNDLKDHRELVKSLFPDHRYIEIYNGSEETAEVFKGIKKKDKVVICSVSKLLEGIHLPNMEGILLFRKVKSTNVFEQILGRILAINSNTSPIFVDCTSTAAKLLYSLLHTNKSIIPPNNSIVVKNKDILKVSLKNKKYFEISELLMNLSVKEFTFRDITYPSFYECCRCYNINPTSTYTYIDKGMSKEEALEYCIENMNKFIVDNVNYETCKNACKAFNISYQKVSSYRNRNKCTLMEAFMIYKQGNITEVKEVSFRGKIYSSMHQCCKEYDASSSTISKKMKELGTTFEETLEQYLIDRANKETPTWNGKTYISYKEMYKDLGITQGSVSRYIKSGLSRKQAIQKSLDNKKDFSFRGQVFASYNKCCQYYGINTSKVFNRCKKLGDVSKQEGLESILQEKGL